MPEHTNRPGRQNCNFDSLFPELCYPKNREHWRDLTACVEVRDPCEIGIEGLFPPAGRRPAPEPAPEAVAVGNDELNLNCASLPDYFGDGTVTVSASTFRRFVANPKDTATIAATKTFLNNLAKAFGLSQLECFVGNEEQVASCPDPDSTLEGVAAASNTTSVVADASITEVFSGILYALNAAARLSLTEAEVENGWYIHEVETNQFFPIVDKNAMGTENAFGAPVNLAAAFAARFASQTNDLNLLADTQAKLNLTCRYELDAPVTRTCAVVLDNPDGLNEDLGTPTNTLAAEDFGYFQIYNADAEPPVFNIVLDGPTNTSSTLDTQAELFVLSNLECVLCSPEFTIDCPVYEEATPNERHPFGSSTTTVAACRNQTAITFDENGTQVPATSPADLFKTLWQQALAELSFSCFYGNAATEVKCGVDDYEGDLCGLSESTIQHRNVTYTLPDAIVIEDVFTSGAMFLDGNSMYLNEFALTMNDTVVAAVRGVYLRDGDYEGKPRYTLEGGTTMQDSIFWDMFNWVVTAGGIGVYSSDENVDSPELVQSWVVETGSTPIIRKATISDFPELLCNLEVVYIPELSAPPLTQTHKKLADEISQAFSGEEGGTSCDLEVLEAAIVSTVYEDGCAILEKPEDGWQISSEHSVEGELSENLFLTPLTINGGDAAYINLNTPQEAIAAINQTLQDGLANAVQTSDENAEVFAEAQTVCLFCNEPVDGLTCPAADESILIDGDPDNASPTLRYLEARSGRDICGCEFVAPSKLEAQRMAYAAALAARDCIPTGYGNDEVTFVCPTPSPAEDPDPLETAWGPGLQGQPPIVISANTFTGATKFEAQQLAHNVGCALLDCRFGNIEVSTTCGTPPVKEGDFAGWLINNPGIIVANTYFATTQEDANDVAEIAAAALSVCIPASTLEQYIGEISIKECCAWRFIYDGNPNGTLFASSAYEGDADVAILITRDAQGKITGVQSDSTTCSTLECIQIKSNDKLNFCGSLFEASWFCVNGAPFQKFIITGGVPNDGC